jgi:hypothetical protein
MAEFNTEYRRMTQASTEPDISWKMSPSLESSLNMRKKLLFLFLKLEKLSDIKAEASADNDFVIGFIDLFLVPELIDDIIGFLV